MWRYERVYLKVWKNRMELNLLDSKKTISRTADIPFSSDRIIVSNFLNGKNLLRQMARELMPSRINRWFSSQSKTVVQCMEIYPDGLTDVEKFALRNIAELNGSRYTLVINADKPLTERQLEDLFKTF